MALMGPPRIFSRPISRLQLKSCSWWPPSHCTTRTDEKLDFQLQQHQQNKQVNKSGRIPSRDWEYPGIGWGLMDWIGNISWSLLIFLLLSLAEMFPLPLHLLLLLLLLFLLGFCKIVNHQRKRVRGNRHCFVIGGTCVGKSFHPALIALH